MTSYAMAVIFGFAAVMAVWSILSDLASDRSSERSNASPLTFALVLACKGVVILYGLASIGYALHLNGDPAMFVRGLLNG